ncbi:hypothetical protein C0J52_12000 [Blattella germanica]|nr:hypothetical protein C0J52_12000 [Blattella germanica]
MQSRKSSTTQYFQSFITTLAPKLNVNKFILDLCDAIVGANIPLEKINIPVLKSFLEKYMKNYVSHPSTLQKKYILTLYAKVSLFTYDFENK